MPSGNIWMPLETILSKFSFWGVYKHRWSLSGGGRYSQLHISVSLIIQTVAKVWFDLVWISFLFHPLLICPLCFTLLYLLLSQIPHTSQKLVHQVCYNKSLLYILFDIKKMKGRIYLKKFAGILSRDLSITVVSYLLSIISDLFCRLCFVYNWSRVDLCPREIIISS